MTSANASEFWNSQLYLTKLTDALRVPTPGFAGSGYEFEFKVRVVHRDGSDSINRVDLFKQGCFLLEAKHAAESANAEMVFAGRSDRRQRTRRSCRADPRRT